MLGSGFSDKPDNYLYTAKEHANYLYNFVQELKLNKFIIFAHSLGEVVALELADKCRDNIEIINKNSSVNFMWAAILSVYSSTTISRISKPAGYSMAWENLKGLAEAIKKGILYAREL